MTANLNDIDQIFAFIATLFKAQNVFYSFHGLMKSINWPAPSVWVFITQLVEHCIANAEATGSNPVRAPINVFRVTSQNDCDSTAMVTYTYFKKGCFSDACFIDRSASCLLNLWLLISSYRRTCSTKTRPNVHFFMIWFSPGVSLAIKRSRHLFKANMMLCGL